MRYCFDRNSMRSQIKKAYLTIEQKDKEIAYFKESIALMKKD